MNSRSSDLTRAGCLLVFLLAVFFLAGEVLAGGLENARRRGKLLAGVKTDFPPFGYLDSAGAPQGFDVDIARYLARSLFEDDEEGLELVPVTSGNRIPFLYREWIDVIIASTSITEERRKVLEFSKPYFTSGSTLLVREDSAVAGPEDLAGKSVGVVMGAIQEQDIRELAPGAAIVRFEKVDEALRALKAKDVDVFCEDNVVIVWLARRNPGLRVAGQPFRPRTYAAAVRKGDVKFLNWINSRLDRARREGDYEKLLLKYFGEAGEGMIKP